jgi:hypothetical protein
LRAAAALLAALAVAGCQSSSSAPPAGSYSDAVSLYAALGDEMKACWFAGDPAFTAYVYSPEINAGTPRILIVPKGEPTALPLLVVEAKGRASADYYGPLLASEPGPRIRADLDLWIRGGRGCA